ncbi:MAG: type II secretion system protein, partial [Verrucomicrobiota bacterium]
IYCVSNLKQIGLSCRIYAGDNRERYPMNLAASTNDTPVVNEATPAYQYFQLLSNKLGTPKILLCPSDKKRTKATSFPGLSNSNLSYFISLDANDKLPQTVLAGDRNITNGFAPRNGILDLTTNQMVGFTDEMHLKQGNIAVGDGSVQQVSSARFRSEIIKNSDIPTNRIKLP